MSKISAAKTCPSGTKRIGNKCVKGLQKFILRRDDKILLKQKDFSKIEGEYAMEWLNYSETAEPFITRDEYFISNSAPNWTPELRMYTGQNEGHRVVFDVYDKKSYEKIGEITAKILSGKDDAMRFAKDLWNVSEGR